MDNRRQGTPCGCAGDSCVNTLGIAPELSLAMAYVPDQQWRALYSAAEGLNRGTLFRELDFPWLAGRCR